MTDLLETGEAAPFAHGAAGGAVGGHATSGPTAKRPELDRAALLDAARHVVSSLRPEELSGEEAAELVSYFSTLANLASTGRMLCARRAGEASEHLRRGYRSPAEWLAHESGGRLGGAIEELRAAEACEELPGLAEALRSGDLSPEKAAVLAEAADDGGLVAGLLESAKDEDLAGLRRRAEEERARRRCEADELARHEALRSRRFFRHWRDGSGAICGRFSLAPADAAPLLAAIEERANQLFEQAREAGLDEPPAAYRADALCGLAARGEGPRAQVVLRVDAAALRRGERAEGELCEIPGVGAVPLAHARELLGDATLDVVIRDGVEICSVSSLRRRIRRSLRVALAERDPTCVVPGCGVAHGLEIDHWRVDFAEGGPTELSNLARLCRFHHRMKTHRGWRLTGGPGRWAFVPPEEDRVGPFDDP